jgi:beta-glucosidase-like glycosyl hydrolase
MQDVKWDGCEHPWPSEGGSCTPAPFSGGSNYTRTVDETVHAALVQGGIDHNCGALYRTNLYSSLQRGAVSEKDVDTAATRLYRTHFRLGFFDPPDEQPLNFVPPSAVDSATSRAVALRAAREGLVLLRNEAVGAASLLPLPAGGKGLKLAFVGPHANASQDLLSNYHGQVIA